MLANIAGLARPVRMAAKSSRATPTALSIFSSASSRVSSITVVSLLLAASAQSLEAARATSVPIFSPRTARAMLPSVSRSNTMIGSALSMHRLNAVASATFRPAAEHLGVGELGRT